MFCPKCKNEVNRPEAKFCSFCGGSLFSPPVKTCPKCGFPAQQGNKFCKKCGFSLETYVNDEPPAVQEETREINKTDFKPEFKNDKTEMPRIAMTCPRCGVPAQGGHKFCSSCGYTITDAGVAPTLFSLEQSSRLNEGAGESAEKIESRQSSSFFTKRKLLWVILMFIVVAVSAAAAFAFLQGYILDQTPPEAAISSPAGDKTITLNTTGETARETIKIKAEDNRRLKKVDLLINAVPVKSFENFDSIIYNWEADKEGKYTFYAVAQDYCGNTDKSSPLVIEVRKTINSPVGVPDKEKQVIEGFVNNWVRTIVERNLNEHMACYADNLDIYYTTSNMSKSNVYKNRQEMFDNFSKITMSIYNLQVNMGSNNSATATFNKKWDCSGKETFSGEVLQRLSLKNINGKWQITGEEELKILWAIRNGKKIE